LPNHPDPPADLARRRLPLVSQDGPGFRIHRRSLDALHFGKSGHNRFDAPGGEFGVLYLGSDEACAFIETFGHATGTNLVTSSDLATRCLSRVRSRHPLRLVDLSGPGLGRLGSTATTGLDSKPSGFWIQPSYRFGQYELVARYGQVDSDGRGIQPGDLIRSAPSVATGLTMDTMNDWYFGLNWYILGNDLKHDVKFQIGYTKATSKDRLVPAAAPVGVKELTTEGVRAQMQINF
jgi:hypothetical protein